MAVSSLQRYLRYSLENEVPMIDGPVEPIDESTEQEMNEAIVQCEEIQEEIEVLEQDRQRVESAVNQLEEQNEAIEGVVRTEGELAPAAAAGFEAARRAVAAGLGLNPDEGAGEQIVDEVGLESMVKHRGLISLEENKTMIQKLRDMIAGILKRIEEGWKKFKLWFQKITNILPKKIRPLYNELKQVDDETFKSIVSEMDSVDSNKTAYGGLFSSGKLVDSQNKLKEWEKFISETSSFKQSWHAYRAIYAESKGKDIAPYVEKLRESTKALAEKLDGKSFDSGPYIYKWENKDGVPHLNEEVSSRVVETNFSEMTKSDLLTSLNSGLGLSRMQDKLTMISDLLNSVVKECDSDLAKANEGESAVAKEYAKMCNVAQRSNAMLYKAGKEVSLQIKAVVDIAQGIVNSAKKQAKPKE